MLEHTKLPVICAHNHDVSSHVRFRDFFQHQTVINIWQIYNINKNKSLLQQFTDIK